MTVTEEITQLQNERSKIVKIMNGLSSTEDKTALADNLYIIDRRLAYYDRQAKKILQESNIGKRWETRTFATFDTKHNKTAYQKAKKYAEDFIKNSEKGLIFFGKCGSGKTHLAVAIANYVITEHKIPVKFGTFGSILEQLKKSFQTDEDIVSQLVNTPLLIIDDIGKERKSEWSDSVLFEIINGRYEKNNPIIVTTNMDVQTLRANIGDAIFSRLCEMCAWIKMADFDYRTGGKI